MTTTDESVTDDSTESTVADAEVQETDPTSADQVKIDPDLGAKNAIIKERTARREAEKALSDLRAEIALKEKPADEQVLEQVRREAVLEATAKANERIVRSEVKAAATGKVKNPALALKLIDMSGIDVDDDGEPDSDAIASAIAALLTDYPELAAVAPGFGSADQGAKGRTATSSQLTVSDLDSMSPEAVNAARKAGRLDKVLGIKH